MCNVVVETRDNLDFVSQVKIVCGKRRTGGGEEGRGRGSVEGTKGDRGFGRRPE